MGVDTPRLRGLQSALMPIHTDIAAAAYHADPAPEPSLSSSVARILVERSPRHAWWAHPRLNPDFEPDEDGTARPNLGAAAHAVALECDWDRIAFIEAADWRTKAAKDLRTDAILGGRIPLLEKNRPQVTGMVAALAPLLPEPRKAEATLIWQEPNGAWCRARPDAMAPGLIVDVKTTTMAATPDGWGRRQMWEYAMQAGLYRRGYAQIHVGDSPAWRFVVQEQYPPYAAATFCFDNESLAYCDRLAERAIELWGACMASGEWPGYPAGANVAEMPAWMRAKGESE